MDSNSTFKAQFDDIISSINKASSSSELEIINGRIVTLRKNMIAAGLDGKNAFSTMSAAVQKFSQYVGASTIVLSLLGGFRDIINNVIKKKHINFLFTLKDLINNLKAPLLNIWKI